MKARKTRGNSEQGPPLAGLRRAAGCAQPARLPDRTGSREAQPSPGFWGAHEPSPGFSAGAEGAEAGPRSQPDASLPG